MIRLFLQQTLLNCLLRQRFLIGVAQINLQLSNNIYSLNNNQKAFLLSGVPFCIYNSGYELIRRLQNLLSFPYDGDPICLEPKNRNIIS